MPKFSFHALISSRSFWALTDQGIVSAGNFVTSLLLARHLLAEEFGVFVLLNSIYQMLFGLQGNLIIAPMMVLLGGNLQENSRSQLTSALVYSAATIFPFSLLMLGAAASLHHLETGAYALLYLTFWQFQETTRRALTSTFRYAETLIGDAVSYPLQAALLWILLDKTSLTLNQVFLVMAATSAAAMAIQLVQAGARRASLAQVLEDGRGFWKLGKWLAVVSMTTIAIAPISTWLLNFFQGRVAAAIYQAVMNVVGIANPVILSIPGLVIPLIAAGIVKQKDSTAPWGLIQAARFTTRIWLLLTPLYLFLLIAPGIALRWFYGAGSIYASQTLSLRIAVLVSVITIPLTVYNAVLTGLGLTRENASINGIGAIVSILLAPPCAYFGGTAGVLAAEAANRTARAAWAYRSLQIEAPIVSSTIPQDSRS